MTVFRASRYISAIRAADVPVLFAALSSVFFPRCLGVPMAALAVILAARNFKHWNPRALAVLFLPIAMICALFAFSLTWTEYLEVSVDRAAKVIPLFFALSFMPIALRPDVRPWPQKQFLYRALSVLMLTGFAFIALDIYCRGALSSLVHDGSRRFNPSDYNRNAVALLFVGLPLLYLSVIKRDRFVAVALTAAMLVTFFSTESLSFRLGIAGFSLCFLLCGTFPVIARPYLAGVLVSIAVLAMPWSIPWLYYADVGFLNDFIASGYPMQRMEIWTMISEQIQLKPFLGHGLESISETKFPFDVSYLRAPVAMHAHNVYLQIWYEMGALGIAFFLGLMFTGLHHVRRLGKSKAFYISVLGAVFLVSGVSYGAWQAWYMGLVSFAVFFSYRACADLDETYRKD